MSFTIFLLFALQLLLFGLLPFSNLDTSFKNEFKQRKLPLCTGGIFYPSNLASVRGPLTLSTSVYANSLTTEVLTFSG